MSRVIKFRAWREGKYEICSDGSVWSTDFNHTGQRKRLKTYRDRDGYETVFFTISGVRRIWAVHRLVAWAFIGEKPTPKHQVNHKNGKRDDNRAENLEWVTSRENTLHGWANGRKVSDKQRASAKKVFGGENNPKAKLTKQQVFEIRRLRMAGQSLKFIAPQFGISIAQVGAITTNRNWI